MGLAKIRNAGAELVVISPNTLEEYRRFGLEMFGEELPYLFVGDPEEDFARRYGILRGVEHHHGGFWHRSVWVIDRQGTITHKLLPWRGNLDFADYQRLFTLIGSEPGEFVKLCEIDEEP